MPKGMHPCICDLRHRQRIMQKSMKVDPLCKFATAENLILKHCRRDSSATQPIQILHQIGSLGFSQIHFWWNITVLWLLMPQHRWKPVPETFCIQVCPSVNARVCASRKLCTPYLKNQSREFHPILVIAVIGFIDVLIWFWIKRSKLKVTAGNDPRSPENFVNAISQQPMKRNSPMKFWSEM